MGEITNRGSRKEYPKNATVMCDNYGHNKGIYIKAFVNSKNCGHSLVSARQRDYRIAEANDQRSRSMRSYIRRYPCFVTSIFYLIDFILIKIEFYIYFLYFTFFCSKFCILGTNPRAP